MSAAQYLREAAVARLNYTAGRRGDREMETAMTLAGAPLATAVAVETEPASAAVSGTPPEPQATTVAAKSDELRSDGTALSAQSQLIISRAQTIRERSVKLRAATKGVRE